MNQMEPIGWTDRKLSLSEHVKAGIEYADTSQAKTDGTITQKGRTLMTECSSRWEEGCRRV